MTILSFVFSHMGRQFGPMSPLAFVEILPQREIPSLRPVRRSFAVSARISAWVVVLAHLSCLLSPLKGRAETAFPSLHRCSDHGESFPAAIPEGFWRGVVVFEGKPVPFTIDVSRFAPDSVRVTCAGRTLEVAAAQVSCDRIVVALTPSGDERLEGVVLRDTFVGRFQLSSQGDEVTRSFPFRATREPRFSDRTSGVAVDFTGEWNFLLHRDGEPDRRATAVMGQGREKIHVLWREPDGTRRYFSGLGQGSRLGLEAFPGTGGQIHGSVDPLTGVLSGRLIDATGSVRFTASRRSFTRIINLAGRD